MQQYDIALKLLLQGQARLTIRELTGGAIEKWLDIELPKVQNLRMDLLGQTADGDLVHVELQSGNDAAMPLRMAEYCLGVYRLFGKFPRQVLLYVGEPPLGMARDLIGPDLSFRYRALDIRELDGDRLIETGEAGDNIIAILARLRDHKEAVRRIVGKIAGLAAPKREAAFSQLLILAGLRRLAKTVRTEIQKMPIFIDILENEVIGPAFARGELTILRRLIEKRFGTIPVWAEERLANWPVRDLEELGVRMLDARSLEDLLKERGAADPQTPAASR